MSYDRDLLRSELIRDEGLRLKAYRDSVGKLSIGVGRNLDDVGIRPDETRALGITKATAVKYGITNDQAMVLLNSDIYVAEGELDKRIPWWRNLDDVRQRVLMNMVFNMGITTLMTFKNTLNNIGNGNYAAAADSMSKSLWARQVGPRAERLIDLMRG